jgi:hypothetical protein
MSIAPILLSLSLLAFWGALGWSLLALAEPAMAALRSFFLAPLVGVAATLLPVFWLSLAGVPVSAFARPLLVVLCILAIGGWTWRRPAWTRSELIFLVPMLAAILIIGLPALRFGFDWVGNANDDWANYSLSAIRLLNDGYFQRPPIELMRSGQYYPGFLWFLVVARDARPGGDLLLAWVAGAFGKNPFLIFMPVILALHGVMMFAAAGLAMASFSRRLLLAAVVLLAVAPLNLYAVHQQLIAQVMGLGFMCGVGALAFVPLRELQGTGRIALITVVAAAYLLAYPETLPFFGVAFLLYHARHIADAHLDWKGSAKILIAPVGACILLGPYSVSCYFFLLSQIETSATQGLYDGGSIFPYFLVPNGIAVLFGISRLGELLTEPWLSLSIAVGLSLMMACCFGMAAELVRGRPVSYYLLAVCIGAAIIVEQQNNFGLFKAAMFAQAFIWFILVAVLSRLGIGASRSVYALILLLMAFTDLKYLKASLGDDIGSGSFIARGSRDRLLTRLLEQPAADSCDENFDTPNPPLVKLLAARVGCARAFVARPDLFSKLITKESSLGGHNPLHDLFGIASHSSRAAARLESHFSSLSFFRVASTPNQVLIRKPVIEFAKVGDDWSSDSIYGGQDKKSEPLTAVPAGSNELIFLNSSFGGHYYFPDFRVTSLFQTQRDFFYPEGRLAAVGRYLLFRINSPAKLGRLVLNLTTTVFGDGCACLPPVSVVGDEEVAVGVSGHGAARVVSPAFSPKIVDGIAYLLIDLGADARLFDTPRSGLMGLYGTSVPIDYRKMAAYVRQIRFVDAANAEEVRPPSKIDNFPSDLAAAGLEFSGIYEDGWIGDQGFVTLYAESAGVAVMRGAFPADIGLDGVEVTMTVGSAPPVRKRIKPGPFMIAAPVAAGRSRISFRFSDIGRLPSGDGRPAIARLTSVAIVADRDHSTTPSELFDQAPLSGASLPKILEPVAEAASGVYADGWIGSAADIVVNLKSVGKVTLHGMVPGGVGLEGQEIVVDGGVDTPIRRQLMPGEFAIDVPVKAGRSKISLQFTKAVVLPQGDDRNVAALLRSIQADFEPSLSISHLKRVAKQWLTALRNWF